MGLTALKRGLQSAASEDTSFAWPPEHEPDCAPYRGLKLYEAKDAAIFFGRNTAVDADYAITGPNHHYLRHSILASAAALFRRLEDRSASKEWQRIDIEWTSEPPIGVSTTCTVTSAGKTIEEYVLAWEPGKRMCFRYDQVTLPLAAFAEDYVIHPKTDS